MVVKKVDKLQSSLSNLFKGTVVKPAELNAVILMHCAFQVNRLNSGSAGPFSPYSLATPSVGL